MASIGSIDALLKKYRDVIHLGTEDRPKTWISVGPLSLNLAIGDARGIRAGRILQIVGKYSSGKSTLALDIIRQHQASDPESVVAYVDFERAFDPDYAQKIGIDLDRIHIVTADSTEQGFDIVEGFVKTGEVRLVIIDSIAAARSGTEDDKTNSDNAKMATSAGAITRFCNRVVPLLDNYDVLLVVLNQLRSNFNTLSPEKEIPFGSKALQYAASVTIQTTAVSTNDQETEIQATVKKNKVGAPRKVVKFFIRYGMGIDHDRDILDTAVNMDIVEKNKGWYKYEGENANGVDRAREAFPIADIRNKILGNGC